MFNYEGKTVVVTGGSRGIGNEIVHSFLKSGANVVCGSRTPPKENRGELFIETDVTQSAQVEKLAEKTIDQFGNIDVFINNAGVSVWKSIDKIDDCFLSNIIDTNLKGCFWGCKAAASRMTKGGTIINIASLAGKRGSKNNSAYCASKFGVVGLTQALAKELGEKGIRVNSVCPVYVETEELKNNLSGDHPDVGNMKPSDFLVNWAQKNSPLQRLPTASEIADLCMFLGSSYSSAITGQNINIDCGVLPQ